MIAVIPARGGSKGLPRKNVLPLAGKPLITHTISAALQSHCIDKVIVTTDDEEIAEVAREAGALVPFMRPAHLASDTASAVDVYIHVIEWIRQNMDETVDKIMVLLPTSPLRTSEDIDNAYNTFLDKKATTLIAVTDAPVPPAWFLEINSSDKLIQCNFGDAGAVQNRQNYSNYYIPCGAIYILDYSLLKEKRTYYCENTVAYVMPVERAVDIDNKNDFDYVEYLISRIK